MELQKFFDDPRLTQSLRSDCAGGEWSPWTQWKHWVEQDYTRSAIAPSQHFREALFALPDVVVDSLLDITESSSVITELLAGYRGPGDWQSVTLRCARRMNIHSKRAEEIAQNPRILGWDFAVRALKKRFPLDSPERELLHRWVRGERWERGEVAPPPRNNRGWLASPERLNLSEAVRTEADNLAGYRMGGISYSQFEIQIVPAPDGPDTFLKEGNSRKLFRGHKFLEHRVTSPVTGDVQIFREGKDLPEAAYAAYRTWFESTRE